MAAEVGQQFSGWSRSDLTYNDNSTQVDDSVQQMVLDHGSVSFGRFAAESLSWESRSVFAHNRRQEEIRKLTLPGLVAQKKAFFEEYYRRKAQKVTHPTEATLEERSDDNTLEHSMQEDKSHAVISEAPVGSAPSSSFEQSTGVSSSDENKCQEPHGLGYLTFNPLFSRITESLSIQQKEACNTGPKQYADGQCATHTSRTHGLNHETLERKVLAPKHVLRTDYGESNVAPVRIVLPVKSLQSKGLKVDLKKQEPSKSIAVINKSTKGTKAAPGSLIQIPRVDLRRNSEIRHSQGLKDPFHERVEMKLRALSDRMSADRAACSSKSVSYQPATGSSCQNADRVATSSRSALCRNADRTFTSSKSVVQASHKSFKVVQRTTTLPSTNFYNKGSHASHLASSNRSKNSTTGKLAARSSIMPSSSEINAKPIWTAQVTSKRAAAALTSVGNGSQNKRKQLSTRAASDENNHNRGFVCISAPTSARSSYDNIRPYKAAKAPRISNGKSAVKTETVQKSTTYPSHHVGGRNVFPKHNVNCNEPNRKVISSRAGSLSSSARKNLACKTRQERPRWR